jgi:hypothetical protein
MPKSIAKHHLNAFKQSPLLAERATAGDIRPESRLALLNTEGRSLVG